MVLYIWDRHAAGGLLISGLRVQVPRRSPKYRCFIARSPQIYGFEEPSTLEGSFTTATLLQPEKKPWKTWTQYTFLPQYMLLDRQIIAITTRWTLPLGTLNQWVESFLTRIFVPNQGIHLAYSRRAEKDTRHLRAGKNTQHLRLRYDLVIHL